MKKAVIVVLASVALICSGRRVTTSRTELTNALSATKKPSNASALNDTVIPIKDRTDFVTILGTASILCIISGMVNVVSFLEIGIPVAHHTGSATHVGRLMGTDAPMGKIPPGSAAMTIGIVLVSYVSGAAAAGFAQSSLGLCVGENVFLGKFSIGLLSSAALVAIGASIRQVTGAVTPTVSLWSFSQGLQNAITTNAVALVGFPVRTTDVTGAATDLGSEIGQWLSAKVHGKPPPSLRKPLVFAASIFFFGLGGYIVRFLHPRHGALTALLPAAILAIIAAGRPF